MIAENKNDSQRQKKLNECNEDDSKSTSALQQRPPQYNGLLEIMATSI